MSREIKFRAWDKEERMMLHDDFSVSPKGNLFFWDVVAQSYSDIKPSTEAILMQFTGLHDKNGKEIYEGDIVKGVVEFPQLTTMDTDDNSNFKMAGIVFYDHHGFQLKVIQHLCDEDREGMVNYFSFIGNDGEVFDHIEVIGNIYENPELLK
jgi:uncharacterized phage protein (TIGR01671 family)